MCWLVVVTLTAGYQKIFDSSPAIGFLAQAQQLEQSIAAGSVAAAKIADTQRVIFNLRLDAWVTALFLVLVIVILADALRHWLQIWSGRRTPVLREAAFVPSAISGD
jgi:carbon starvation protein